MGVCDSNIIRYKHTQKHCMFKSTKGNRAEGCYGKTRNMVYATYSKAKQEQNEEQKDWNMSMLEMCAHVMKAVFTILNVL